MHYYYEKIVSRVFFFLLKFIFYLEILKIYLLAIIIIYKKSRSHWEVLKVALITKMLIQIDQNLLWTQLKCKWNEEI